MRYWQVQAETAAGGTFTFGVQAEDREAALTKAQLAAGLVSQENAVTGMQVAEIPPRRERGPAARRPVD